MTSAVRSEGGLLPLDLLERVGALDEELAALTPAAYGLAGSERISEAVNRSWTRLLGVWEEFHKRFNGLPAGTDAAKLTREQWLRQLFEELGYGQLTPVAAIAVGARRFPTSHAYGNVLIHLVGARQRLDERVRTGDKPLQSAHGLVQQALNESDEHLWGITSNGLDLRLLRDNAAMTRQAFLDFDLEQIMIGEQYADFALLWLCAHATRFGGVPASDAPIERWVVQAQEQGTRALDQLRAGVRDAIEVLATGFLAHANNFELRDALASGAISDVEYHRQILRRIYQLLVLFVAEDRDLLHPPVTAAAARRHYSEYYGSRRLRRLASLRRGTQHDDLGQALQIVLNALGDPDGQPALGLSPLGGLYGLAQTPDLDRCQIRNVELLSAIRSLATVPDAKTKQLRLVDFRRLGSEELGSVYESLLEDHPRIDLANRRFTLGGSAASERKTSGSYYTPSSLVEILLDQALDPLLQEAEREDDPAAALLAITVLDPACGSGHFLVAAAQRIARRLALVREAGMEPLPEVSRHALREVIGRCLFGVDVNPMAVELCKVSLWMEALEPGKPLGFLDAHIKCGNSLIGTSLEAIDDGIPDDAFRPLIGDDRDVATAIRKQNRDEREGQLTLADLTGDLLGELGVEVAALDATDDGSVEALNEKARRFAALSSSGSYERIKLTADAWCAAFVQRKNPGVSWITSGVIRRIALGQLPASDAMDEIRRLASLYAFFHWEIEFPQVFSASGNGFDVVLGNPPWGQTELAEKEFFAHHIDIASARNAAIRKRLIAELEWNDPALHAQWLDATRGAEGRSHFVRTSGRFPLCGRGRVNTYSVFAELMRSVLSGGGRSGCILPTGIITDDTTRAFSSDVLLGGYVVSLYDFENKQGLFPDVAPVVKFCLMTLRGTSDLGTPADFCFFLVSPDDLEDRERHVQLSPADIALVSPNSLTAPIFRSRRDADLTREVYARLPVLVRVTSEGEVNPWDLSLRQGMVNLASDSNLFQTREELDSAGFVLEGGTFRRGAECQLPLYEAKLFHQFTHRFNTYDGVPADVRFNVKAPARPLTQRELRDPNALTVPRYWVNEVEVRQRVGNSQRWHVAFRDMTNVMTNRRNAVFALLPDSAVGHSAPMVSLQDARQAASFMAMTNSFVFDYLVRQRLAGGHLTFGILKQIPSLPPGAFESDASLPAVGCLGEWLLPRVIELTFTAVDVERFARDCGFESPPYIWDDERRFMMNCEIDAAMFHAYGLGASEVEYVMDTFPIVMRRDVEQYGDFRTKDTILEVFRTIGVALERSVRYETALDPPPGA